MEGAQADAENSRSLFVGAGMLQSQLNVRLLHFFQLLTGLERYRVAGQYRGRRNCYYMAATGL